MRYWLLVECMIVVVGSAHAAEYWPYPKDKTYHYMNANGETMVANWVASGTYVELIASWYGSTGALSGTSRASFAIDSNGDVFLNGCTQLTAGGDISELESYEPPIKFLDLPIVDIGQAWQSLTRVSTIGPGYWCVWLGYFERPEMVTVPYGTFETLVVTQSDCVGASCYRGTYYLHRELGAVVLPGGYELVGIDSSVTVENSTWGALKSLYR